MAFWVVAVQLGLLALSLVASYYLAPSPLAERKKFGGSDLSLPRATEGDPIPLIYGTCRVRSPVVVSVGAMREGEVHSQSLDFEITEQAIFLTMRLVLGLGNAPVGESLGARFIAMYMGDKQILPGPGAFVGSVAPGFVEYYGYDTNVLGGPNRGGGWMGVMTFYGGTTTQTRTASDKHASEDTALLPNYRGMITVSLHGTSPTDEPLAFQYQNPAVGWAGWMAGELPSIPVYSFVVANPVKIPGVAATNVTIGDGDANPAAVIYDILTNKWGRLGNDTSRVDVDSFALVAQTLLDEEHGVSLMVPQPSEARTVIEDILRQIDGVLIEDPTTRKYVLKLIREDYVVANLPVFDVTNIIGEPELPSTLWEETVSEVRVIYTDPAKGYADGVALAQNLALVAASGGRKRTSEYRFPGVSNGRLAYHLASRELNFLGRPISKLLITVNRSAYNLRPGDPFVFTWAAWNMTGVYRVSELDLGELESGAITITAVQDRFAISHSVFDPPEDEIGETTPRPRPILLREITEAPRWIQLKAYEDGVIANIDAQRSMSLALPVGSDTLYRVDRDGAGIDLSGRPFPGSFVVDVAYARISGPYDTSTGLRIRGLLGWTPTATTAAAIATTGVNLISLNGEILSFETVADNGGGVYTLGNVGRGDFDTAPADHAVGDTGYVLGGSRARAAMGRLVMTHGTTYEMATLAAVGSTWTPASDSPQDTITSRSRVRLPARGAALLVNSSTAPAALEEEGVTLDWRDRNATTATIIRGDAGDETLESGQTFDAVAYKGDGPQDGGTQVVLAAGHSSHTLKVALGAAGHGVLEVGVDTKRAVAMPDGTTPTLRGWQVPTWPILAPHWRNLLLNPRATDVATLAWTWTIGAVSYVVASAQALGGAGGYITAASGTAILDGYQERDLTGYLPDGYKAILDFAAVRDPLGADTNDTVTVYLYSKNAAGTILDTATYGPASPATWAWQTLEIAKLNAAAVSIRVRVVLTAATELDTTASCAVTEFHLRGGQISDQLLENPSFEAGVTDWTESIGTWQALTATPYGSATYARPNDGAAAQLRQDPAITTGYEGGVAVLRCGRMNDAAGDTGTVTLQALGAGDAIVGSASTADEAITPTSTWARRHLALELPAATLKVRVQLDATRVAGTPLNSCFDDFDLRLHKHLDPDETISLAFSTPATQRLPGSIYQWYAAFPAVVAPNLAILDGDTLGKLGTEPLFEVVGSALALALAVVDQGRPDSVQTTTAYEMPARGVSSVQAAPVGTSFANFSSTQSWAAQAFFRVREPGAWDGAADLCGRVVGGVGWYLWITYGGRPAVTLIGATGTVTVTGTEAVTDGDLCGVGVSYDAGTDIITLVDALGTYTAAAASIGEFRADDVGRFSIWGSGSGLPPFVGQVIRCYLWRGERPTGAEIATTLTYATTPAAMALLSW